MKRNASSGVIRSILYVLFLPTLQLSLIVQASHAETDTPVGGMIEIITTFDSPKPDTGIFSYHINDSGEIVGNIDPFSLRSYGFLRLRNGQFKGIIEPNTTFTQATGLNNLGLICGEYYEDRVGYHGYFFSHDTGFTQFDVPGSGFTAVGDINDAGDFCGFYGLPGTLTSMAFESIAGNITTIDLPDSPSYAFADGINNGGQVVGAYTVAGVVHGFFRDEFGNVTAPIDVAGATTTTTPLEINDRGFIVGFTGSPLHGFVLKLPNSVITFDYTGATGTALGGINNADLIAGSYYDSASVSHGFVAKLKIAKRQ